MVVVVVVSVGVARAKEKMTRLKEIDEGWEGGGGTDDMTTAIHRTRAVKEGVHPADS